MNEQVTDDRRSSVTKQQEVFIVKNLIKTIVSEVTNALNKRGYNTNEPSSGVFSEQNLGMSGGGGQGKGGCRGQGGGQGKGGGQGGGRGGGGSGR